MIISMINFNILYNIHLKFTFMVYEWWHDIPTKWQIKDDCWSNHFQPTSEREAMQDFSLWHNEE
jgi:hypothetical protein